MWRIQESIIWKLKISKKDCSNNQTVKTRNGFLGNEYVPCHWNIQAKVEGLVWAEGRTN